ncbi:MAG: tRNA (adenosine(37)-N6)-dimethylallyltransferase MiaA [Pseudomonadota bacterium]
MPPPSARPRLWIKWRAYSGIPALAQGALHAYSLKMHRRHVLIAGPTAAGKSALAIRLAQTLNGVVINADSQQVYRAWRILTARPTDEDISQAPHRLFGHVDLDQDYSTGHWLDEVKREIEACDGNSQTAIIAGGTGLYFKALTEGLAEIPRTEAGTRERGEAALARLGLDAFRTELAMRDPETCRRIDIRNPRRVLRAWEVLETTGHGIAHWQDGTPPPVLPLEECLAIALVPPRDWLYARCEARFDRMIGAGALDEVRQVLSLDLASTAPGLRAVGAPDLIAHERGETSLEDAVHSAKTETRRYAKRQLTWIRNQMEAWQKLDPSDSGAIEAFCASLETSVTADP